MKRFAAMLALLASACTFTQQGDAEFHPPLVYQPWHSTGNGKVCELSSGYNGITVLVRKQDMAAIVKGNRDLEPGTTLTIAVGGRLFETAGAAFSTPDSTALLEAFQHNDKAYLEWSEVRSSRGIARQHVNNIVKLDGFTAVLQQCRTASK